ncbi:MAG TPA: molybdopterin cofactor-binding domain-containing protein, partial [Acidimicrobiales bacterium]
MSILGNRVVRVEDPKLLRGQGTYIDGLKLDGAVWVTYVRSSVAHAVVTGIDVDEALEAPGVLAVFTAADLDLGTVPLDIFMLPSTMPRSYLASDRVRFVGEPVAVVVTEERYQGEDAAERVVVDYDPLPVVVDPAEALAGEVLLFPDTGSNVCFQVPANLPEEGFFEGCDVVVRQRVVNNKVAPVPMEVRVAASAWGDDGRLTHWASSQGAHPVRDRLAEVYGVPQAQVRVIVPDVGGGFGAKGFSYPEELLLPWVARRLGRPARWTETRSESMLGLGHGRGQVQHI